MTERARPRPRSRQVGEVSTTVEHLRRGQVVSEREATETFPVLTSDHPARIRIEGSSTVNMGDYNSVRCSLGIEWPFDPTEEALDAAYQFVSGKVDELIGIELDAATGATTTDAPF